MNEMPLTTDRPDVGERNGLVNPQQYHEAVTFQIRRSVEWTEPCLRITRLRLLSDASFPMWDVSYCHGIIDGEPVDVMLPFSQLPKRRLSAAIIEYAKRDHVYAKGLGILDNISTLC